MRLFLHAVLPVPLSLACLVISLCVIRGPWSLGHPAGGVMLGIVAGYLCMGVQSLLFAAVMTLLDRRGVARRARLAAASAAGALLGATLPVFVSGCVSEDWAWMHWGVLGAAVGPAVAVLVDFVAPVGRKWSPRRGWGVAAAALLFGFGVVGWECAFKSRLDAARENVLGDVSVGMTPEEVMRLAGPADKTDNADLTAQGVVWVYERADPGDAALLVIRVEFEGERVVKVERGLVWRG